MCSAYTLSLASKILNEWFYYDIEQSSTRILNATQITLINHLKQNEKQNVKRILSETSKGTQLYALALCSQSGVFFEKTDNFPDTISCNLNEFSKTITHNNFKYFVRSKSLFENKTFKGQLIIIYELDFIKDREDFLKKYFIELMVFIGVLISLSVM